MSTPTTFIGAGAIDLPMAVRTIAPGRLQPWVHQPEGLAEVSSLGLPTAQSFDPALAPDVVLVMVATAEQAAAVLKRS